MHDAQETRPLEAVSVRQRQQSTGARRDTRRMVFWVHVMCICHRLTREAHGVIERCSHGAAWNAIAASRGHKSVPSSTKEMSSISSPTRWTPLHYRRPSALSLKMPAVVSHTRWWPRRHRERQHATAGRRCAAGAPGYPLTVALPSDRLSQHRPQQQPAPHLRPAVGHSTKAGTVSHDRDER